MGEGGSGDPAASVTIGGVTFDVWVTTAGITRLAVPGLTPGECRSLQKPPVMEIRRDVCGAEAAWIEQLGTFLVDFMGGREPSRLPAVDLDALSGFTVEVLEAGSRVPWGARRSYRWVAARIGRPSSARAVGGALGRNPVPIIVPCHRVTRQDRSPGGFSAGLRWKEHLLNLELPTQTGTGRVVVV